MEDNMKRGVVTSTSTSIRVNYMYYWSPADQVLLYANCVSFISRFPFYGLRSPHVCLSLSLSLSSSFSLEDWEIMSSFLFFALHFPANRRTVTQFFSLSLSFLCLSQVSSFCNLWHFNPFFTGNSFNHYLSHWFCDHNSKTDPEQFSIACYFHWALI
jgi:hypothetical protein